MFSLPVFPKDPLSLKITLVKDLFLDHDDSINKR